MSAENWLGLLGKAVPGAMFLPFQFFWENLVGLWNWAFRPGKFSIVCGYVAS